MGLEGVSRELTQCEESALSPRSTELGLGQRDGTSQGRPSQAPLCPPFPWLDTAGVQGGHWKEEALLHLYRVPHPYTHTLSCGICTHSLRLSLVVTSGNLF